MGGRQGNLIETVDLAVASAVRMRIVLTGEQFDRLWCPRQGTQKMGTGSLAVTQAVELRKRL